MTEPSPLPPGPIVPDYRAAGAAEDSLWAAIARRKSLVVVLGAAALFALALIAYWPALRADFIWDDNHYVTENANLPTLDGLQHLWIPPRDSSATTQYYPLVMTSFWIEYHLWGLNPIGYHVVNVLLHALGATLLWTLLRRLDVPGAWAAAAIFVLHPIHVESVAWIAERKNVLSGVFYFAAMIVLLRYLKVTPAPPAARPDSAKAWFSLPTDPMRVYGIIAVLFACALLSKTVTATLPAAALVIVWWKRGKITWDDVAPLLPLLAMGAVAGWYTHHLETQTIGASGKDWDYAPTLAGEIGARCIIAGRVVWFYLSKLLVPYPLIFNYPRWTISAGDVLQYAFPLSALAVLIALWVARKRIGRAPLAAALLYVGSLFPVLGFFNVYPFRYSFVADHFVYLPSVAIIVAIVAGLKLACDRLATIQVLNPAAGPAGAAIVLVVFGILTSKQTEMYRDVETLFKTTLTDTDQRSWWAANNYAGWLMTNPRLNPRERYDAAERWSFRVLKLKPDSAEARLNLGLIALRRGKSDEALHWFEDSLAQDPNYRLAEFNVAQMWSTRGRVEDAVELYRKLIAQQPDYPDAKLNLAVLLARTNRVQEAIEYYRQAADLDPDSVLAHMGLGSAYVDMGMLAEAAQEFDIVTKLDPKNANAWILLGRLAMEKKRPDIAGMEFVKAIEADPGNPEAWNQVGGVYMVLDKFDRAIEAFSNACELAPDNFDYRANLQRALEEEKKHAATRPATTRASSG